MYILDAKCYTLVRCVGYSSQFISVSQQFSNLLFISMALFSTSNLLGVHMIEQFLLDS